MLRILLVLLASTAFGAGLAAAAGPDVALPLRPGLIGLAAMLLSAWLARRYWQGLKPEGQPGSPERVLWHGLAVYGVLLGHLGSMVWQLAPEFEMHTLRAHALAIDDWTLVLGAIASYFIARDPEPRQDERDTLIRVHGLKAGHRALLAMVIVAALALGFAGNTIVGRFSQPMVAQLLVVFVILQCIVQSVAQLRLYARDPLAEGDLDG